MAVEILLILPLFLLMIFMIMELGYISFQTIVTNHAAYECARIASMVGGRMDTGGPPTFNQGLAMSKCSDRLQQMIHSARVVSMQGVKSNSPADPQTGYQDYDVVVTVENRIPLIFPGSSFLLATPKGSGVRRIVSTVRMPVENPEQWTLH